LRSNGSVAADHPQLVRRASAAKRIMLKNPLGNFCLVVKKGWFWLYTSHPLLHFFTFF
jgi:hypothetical protein